MASLYIGTSGWSYKGWKGTFYPPDTNQSQWLSFYAEHFSTVEINATFYRLPFENMVKGWRSKAPEGFVFAVKGSRRITHYNKLVDVEEDVQTFLDRISGLKEHLGPVLWQLPPSLHKDPARLDAFLAMLPKRSRHAVEFRHPSWLDDEVHEVLSNRCVALVSVSSVKMPVDLTTTADFIYFRFHGLEGGYAHDYTGVELGMWAERAREAVASGLDVFAYFNNDGNTRAPKNARELIQMCT